MGELRQGTPAYRQVNLALFAGGFATFASLYVTQPLLPLLSAEFGVSPAVSSLSLSVATATLAVALLVAGSLADSLGRKRVMTVALVSSGLLGVAVAFSPTFGSLLFLRVLQGFALAGLPATAMAYLGEEVDPVHLGAAMGLYISGNSVGGMGGRIIAGIVSDAFSWRAAVGVVGLVALACSLIFWRSLPPESRFQPRRLDAARLLGAFPGHFRDPGLLYPFALAFLLMGSFVTLYNYISYQLVAPPYNLSQAVVGWIFLTYLVGTFSSAWMGRQADRLGRRRVLLISIGIMLAGALGTLPGLLAAKVLGIGVFTFGFFGAHAIASSWVGWRAVQNKGQASALYLFFYYLGSSVVGTAGGAVWQQSGWPEVVGLIAGFVLMALALASRLAGVGPVPAAGARKGVS